MEENIMMNINEFATIEKRLATAAKSREYEGSQFMSILKQYTGPDKGVQWDDVTGKLSVAPGWHADPDGNVVRD